MTTEEDERQRTSVLGKASAPQRVALVAGGLQVGGLV